MQNFIDMNSDLGEGFGRYSLADDSSLLSVVTSANVACGFHAGDPKIMSHTVKEAISKGVGVGAHPSFPDFVGFGRRRMELSSEEIITDMLYQLGALSAFIQVYGGRIQHVSPHGQLGHEVLHDRRYAEAVVEAIGSYDPSIIIMTQEGELAELANQRGLKVAKQIFADRAYNDDGTLVSRKEQGSVITDQDQIQKRCVRMVKEGKVQTINGKDINIKGDTIVIHSDTKGSAEIASGLKQAFEENGITVKPLGEWLEK